MTSSYDFDALYTHFKWSDIARACDGWRRFVIQRLNDMPNALSSQELSMISCFFGDLDQDFVSSQLEYFPYMNNEPDDSMFLGKFLMNVVFHHCIFLNEGIGVFLQLVGFAMGTNCAPAWAQLGCMNCKTSCRHISICSATSMMVYCYTPFLCL